MDKATLKSAEETYVGVVDAMFDLGQGHRAHKVELPWQLWCRLRAMIPVSKKVGPVGPYKEDGR
jgi:hypothetical protein